MLPPRHLQRNGYHAVDWREEPNLFIRDLWKMFPALVVGKYLVNTSFDSGFLTLSASEKEEGWRMVGQFAHSPRIRSSEAIPHDQFDEWLVFEHPVEVQSFETMVNYTTFSPVDFGCEGERFWEQILALNPLHVLAQNQNVYLVSRDDGIIQRVLKAYGVGIAQR